MTAQRRGWQPVDRGPLACGGQPGREPERAALARHTGDAGVAAHDLGNVPGQGQPEARIALAIAIALPTGFGFSGGAQFAHRFLYIHPGRLRAVSLGAPGLVTMLDETRAWWVGTGGMASPSPAQAGNQASSETGSTEDSDGEASDPGTGSTTDPVPEDECEFLLAGRDASEVLAATAMLAQDRAWLGAAEKRIAEGKPAVRATGEAVDQFVDLFTQVGGLMAERVTDLRDIGAQFRAYFQLMAHFDEVLPGRVHRVDYERMVAHPEQEVRRLLDYCRLPFEAECLRFYDNPRVVMTISSEQVRSPIYSSGIDQWRHYEPWLSDLKAALGNILDERP